MQTIVSVAYAPLKVGSLALIAIDDSVPHESGRIEALRQKYEEALDEPVVLIGRANGELIGRPHEKSIIKALKPTDLVWEVTEIDV